MKTMFRLLLISFSLGYCLSVFSATSISKVTYKWTDTNGIVQYTERPPKNIAYKKITVNTSGGKEITEVTAEEATNASSDSNNDVLDDMAAANKRNCTIAKQNMKVLSNIARIRVSDEKGENRVLTPEEKQTRIDETQKQIDIYCTDGNPDDK
ncbi:MAG: hypothetical protein DRQ47_02360 [Gammaproteobacteria bacterium]|nr:MAG: hypothetical protein DRQ47_02360 [Gammaproteobacteria bacterium]